MPWISPLQLRDYSLLSLHVEANEAFAFAAKPEYESAVGFDFDLSEHADGRVYRIRLTVFINQHEKIFLRAPYRISITLLGFFEIPVQDSGEELSKALLMPNGLAMMYSIARGIVGQATGTSLHGKFLLPTVNFVEVLKEKAHGQVGKKKDRSTPVQRSSKRTKK